MVYGAAPGKPGEAILPQWWRTVDSWSLAALVGLFLIGTLLGLAASPPLAVRTGSTPSITSGGRAPSAPSRWC